MVAKLVAKHGYAFLKAFMPSRSGEDIVRVLGDGIALGGTSVVHQLVPKITDSAPSNTYSGLFGLAQFPLHTDLAHWFLPPRYIMLRCVRGVDSVATLIVDGLPLVSLVGEDVLQRALLQPRRLLKGKMPLLPLLRKNRDLSILRWDTVFLRPVTPAGSYGFSLFKRVAEQSERISVFLTEPGDTLVFDNWRVLHGRSGVDETHMDRLIERAYIGALAQ